MNSLIRYGLASFMFFGMGISSGPGERPQEQTADRDAPLIKPATASREVLIPPMSADKAISDALATHGNMQAIPLSFFTDLVRTMEKSGFERAAAVQVAVTLAKNPKLDNLAGLTIAGSLQGYQETTSESLAEALAELVTYIERPDELSRRANERFGLLSPDNDRLIGEKVGNGYQTAAQRIMEEALLRRFNPPLAARIFVQSDSLGQMPATTMRSEAFRPEQLEQRRPVSAARMLANSSKTSASRRIVIAGANVRTRPSMQHSPRIKLAAEEPSVTRPVSPAIHALYATNARRPAIGRRRE